MEFLEKVKKTATSFAKVSGREGKKLYSITKIKLEITEKQNRVKNLYREIGYDAYKAYKEQSDIAQAVKAKLEEIDSIEDAIAALRSDIDDIKNTEEVGVDDIADEDIEAHDAEIVGEDEEEIETEPIDPIE